MCKSVSWWQPLPYHRAIRMLHCSVIYCRDIATFEITLLQCERFCTNESVLFISDILLYFFFFARWVPTETPGLRPASPLPNTSHLNSQVTIQESCPLTKGNDSAWPRLFYLFQIHPGKTQGLHPHLFQHRAFAQNVYRCFLFCTASPA